MKGKKNKMGRLDVVNLWMMGRIRVDVNYSDQMKRAIQSTPTRVISKMKQIVPNVDILSEGIDISYPNAIKNWKGFVKVN
jgi:hypothetical protein